MRLGLTGSQTRWSLKLGLPGLALAAAAGMLLAVKPIYGFGFAGLIGVGALLSLGRRLPSLFLRLSFVVLLGYALFNRGFAHFGHNPVYIGDVTLLVGLAAVLMVLPRVRFGWIHMVLFAFMGWGLLRTVPYWPVYRFDALRDAALWYYGLYAVVFSCVLTKERLLKVIGWFRRFTPYFLIWTPFAAVLGLALSSHLPPSLDGQTPFLVFNAGETAVFLAGIGAFELTGLAAGDGDGSAMSSLDAFIWPLWIIDFLICSAASRAAFLAAGISSGIAYALYPTKRIVSAFVIGGALLSILLILNPSVDLGGYHRTFSIQQFSDNLLSIVGKENSGDLQGTKDWRLEWWTEIINYTFHGPYFWTGKGFGINLAIADGFAAQGSSLRAPHNGHLDILARMGIPGFTLWIVLQLSILVSFIRGIMLARRHQQPFWARVQVWLFTLWLANIIDMGFDVYLESPQGGIFFWSVVGFGLAVQRLQRADYEEEVAESATRAHEVRTRVVEPLAGRAA
ncbi:MAG TPA: O-antigen ligase family protein [Thermomicrobiaceae bacterium]|nr:O-antigen ligase family protein [Thermomicrobiaceae bacterium]